MKVKKGDLIKTKIYIDKDYPKGSILKVHKVLNEIGEVSACPTWYEDGMKCIGFIVFLDYEDFEVVKEDIAIK